MKTCNNYCTECLLSWSKRIFLISILIYCGVPSYSNSSGSEIKGTIYCMNTSLALEYATISLMSLPDSSNVDNVITDLNGQFRFKDVPEGEYYISVQYMGYEKKFIDSVVADHKTRQIDLGRIGLQISVNDLKEFEVKDGRNALAFEIDRKVIDVSKTLAAEGGTAVDALQNVPSVQVDALGNVLLRGSADYTLLINGKPTMLEPSQVLQQTLAETIESIEIITNPSVKYEASGTTGIINLKLKTTRENRTEGLVNLSVANGDKYSGSIVLNKQFRKFGAFAAISYSNKTQRTENWGYRNVYDADSGYHDSIDSRRKINRLSTDLKIGADYSINDNNNLSISAQIGKWQFERDISSLFSMGDEISPDSIALQNTEEGFLLKNKFLSGDITYVHIFPNKEGHKLDLVAFYGGLINSTTDDYQILDSGYIQRITNNSDRSQLRFSTDYTLPMKDGMSFEAGLFSDVQMSVYDYLFSADAGTDDNEGTDPGEVTEFDYHNSVFASYASVSGEVKKWFSYQAGLRAETCTYSYNDKGAGMNYTSSAINVFPSVHLSRELNESHRFGLSYSRRVNRPDEWQLSPFVYSSDSYVTRIGNPELEQSLIDSYEFSYLLMIGKVLLNTEMYHRYSHSPIGPYLLEVDGQFVETYENLDKEVNSGVELMGVYKPLEWLQFRLTGNVYRSEWAGGLSDGNYIEGSSLQGNGSFTSTFTIKKNTSLQFLAIYYAPGDIPQGWADAFYYFDFILKHSFFNKKLTLGLRTHNTFDSGLYHYTASGESYFSENWYRYEGPVVIFTLSYKLNNFKQKQPKEGVRMNFDSGLDP